MKQYLAQLFIAAMLALLTVSAFGATVNANFTIASASIVDLYSATFDGPLSPCTGGELDPDECTFFNGSQPAGRAIVVTSAPASNATGTFNVDYDSVTGNILTVNSMVINLPDATLTIAGGTPDETIVTIIQGNGVPTANDRLFIESGTIAPNGTADAHQVRTLIGSSVGLFEHDDAPNTDVPDFAIFSDIVDSCTGSLCALIPILSLHGVRYRLKGTVSGTGGDSLQLQAGNKWIYKVNFTTVPVPATAWLFGSALLLLGWLRRKAV
jgi:hypothetical protein